MTHVPPSAHHIRAIAEAYLLRNPGERDGLSALFEALAASDDPTSRKTLPAHVTCSAIVVDRSRRVLHIAHKATGRLLAPGGHNEPEDQDLRSAALRELHEEVGIPAHAVVPFWGYEELPLDINVHAIDASPSKGESAHQHIDFRWLFILPAEHAVRLQNDEVDGFQWRPIGNVASFSVRSKLTLLP